MTKTLMASNRKALIRLASSLPVGSLERRAILAGLGQGVRESRSPAHHKEGSTREFQKAVEALVEAAYKVSLHWPDGAAYPRSLNYLPSWDEFVFDLMDLRGVRLKEGTSRSALRIRGADPDTVDLLGLAIKSAMPYSEDDNRQGTSRYRKFVDQVSRILSKVDRDTASHSIRQVMSDNSIGTQDAMALPLILGFGKAFNTRDMPF